MTRRHRDVTKTTKIKHVVAQWRGSVAVDGAPVRRTRSFIVRRAGEDGQNTSAANRPWYRAREPECPSTHLQIGRQPPPFVRSRHYSARSVTLAQCRIVPAVIARTSHWIVNNFNNLPLQPIGQVTYYYRTRVTTNDVFLISFSVYVVPTPSCCLFYCRQRHFFLLK